MIEPMMTHKSRHGKVVIIAPSAYLLGGVQEWLDYLVSGLESLGWNVMVMLVHGVHSDSQQYLKSHPFKNVSIVESVSGTKEGRVRAIVDALSNCRPDIVLSVNIVDAYEAVERLRQRASFNEMKVAMALHGLNTCFFEDVKRLGLSLDAVIATNKLAVAGAITLAGMPEPHVYYAPCGVGIPAAMQIVEYEKKLQLIFCGRFDKVEKRIMDLPEILNALDREKIDFSLRLAGAGPDEAELRNALQRFGNKVKFLGILDEDQKQDQLYWPGSIILILSPSETGPLVAWEAMAAGVAVVTSRFLGIGREEGLIDKVNCYTFSVGDAEAAAQAVLKLRDIKIRSEIIASAFKTVHERYSKAESVRAWHLALCNIVEEQIQIKKRTVEVFSPAGRLDKIFGVEMAETIRSILGLSFSHREPGSEWPHTYGSDDDTVFRDKLAALDIKAAEI